MSLQVVVLVVTVTPMAVAFGVMFFLILRKRFPALQMLGSPVEQSALRRAEIAERELELANVAIEKLTKRAADLEKERSLAAVILVIERVASGVDQTLAKLADMNGGLRHTANALETTNAGLAATTKAVELLASQIIIDVTRGGA